MPAGSTGAADSTERRLRYVAAFGQRTGKILLDRTRLHGVPDVKEQ